MCSVRLDWKSNLQVGSFLPVYPNSLVIQVSYSVLIKLQRLPSYSLRRAGWGAGLEQSPNSLLHIFSLACGPLGCTPRAQVSRLLWGSLLRQARLGACGGWSLRFLAFPAGAPESKGRNRGQALPAFVQALPPGSAPQDWAVAETCGASQPWGRGAATPGQSFRGCCHPAPPPASSEDVYLALCSLLFSLSLFFSVRVGTPWVQGAQGNPSWLALCSRSPTPRQGAGWQFPSGCAARRPPALQPGLDGGTEFCFSACWGWGGGGGRWWWLKGRWNFPRKSTPRASPSSGRTYPFRPTSCGPGRPALSRGTLNRDFSFPLHYVQRFSPFWPFIPPVGSPRHPLLPEERRLLVRLRVPRGSSVRLALSVLQAAGQREAAPGAGVCSPLTPQLTRGERGTCACLPPQAARFGEDAVWQHWALSSAPNRAQRVPRKVPQLPASSLPPPTLLAGQLKCV